MRAKAWNSTSTTLTRTTAEKWSLHPTVPGVERAGVCVCMCETLAFSASCLCARLTWLFSSFSLGCGIGYGYLHRIPTRPFEEGKKISFPGHTPSEPTSPLKDGFTEVSMCFTWCILIDLVRRLTSVMLCSGSVVCSNSAPCVTACSHRAWGQSVWPVIQLCPVLNTQRAPHRWIVSAFILCFIFFLHCA